MKVKYKFEKIPEDFKECVVTIGVFDGVHIGHQKIIKDIVKQGKILSVSNLVITFEPHPQSILSSNDMFFILTTIQHKLKLFEKYNVENCLVVKTDKIFFNMSAEIFVKDILYKKLRVRQIIIGEDFSFGRNGDGNIKLLKDLGQKYGFTVKSVRLRKINSEAVSSSFIRNLVKQGEFKKVTKFLGRNFSFLTNCKKDIILSRTIGMFCFKVNLRKDISVKKGVYRIEIKNGDINSAGLLFVGADRMIVDNNQIQLKNSFIISRGEFVFTEEKKVEIEITNFIQSCLKFKNKNYIFKYLN